MKNIQAWTQGNLRYRFYYNRYLKRLIPEHIREQIDMRILSMDAVCFNNGTCKLCGCATTALQMANKACDMPCYPPMMNKKEWKEFYKTKRMTDSEGRVWKRKGIKFELVTQRKYKNV